MPPLISAQTSGSSVTDHWHCLENRLVRPRGVSRQAHASRRRAPSTVLRSRRNSWQALQVPRAFSTYNDSEKIVCKEMQRFAKSSLSKGLHKMLTLFGIGSSFEGLHCASVILWNMLLVHVRLKSKPWLQCKQRQYARMQCSQGHRSLKGFQLFRSQSQDQGHPYL